MHRCIAGQRGCDERSEAAVRMHACMHACSSNAPGLGPGPSHPRPRRRAASRLAGRQCPQQQPPPRWLQLLSQSPQTGGWTAASREWHCHSCSRVCAMCLLGVWFWWIVLTIEPPECATVWGNQASLKRNGSKAHSRCHAVVSNRVQKLCACGVKLLQRLLCVWRLAAHNPAGTNREGGVGPMPSPMQASACQLL